MIKAVKDKGVPKDRWAWRSWADDFPADWGEDDCNQNKKGWTTDFVISSCDLSTLVNGKFKQWTSARCKTPEIAVQNAVPIPLELKTESLVTFYLYANYQQTQPFGGGLILSLKKQ